jgi:hypothetical protein
MYVRLGFSIAAHLNPDILLLDEVLAVGDAAFQSKCLERIADLRTSGKSVVFISHDLHAVRLLCDRVLLMERGRLVKSGPASEVIAHYQRLTAAFTPSGPPAGKADLRWGTVRVTNLAFVNSSGVEQSAVRAGDPVSIHVKYRADTVVDNAVFQVFFYSQDGQFKCQLSTLINDKPINLVPGTGTVEFSCPELGLLAGVYVIDVTITTKNAPAGIDLDWQYRCATLCVERGVNVRGEFYMPHRWTFSPDPLRTETPDQVQRLAK